MRGPVRLGWAPGFVRCALTLPRRQAARVAARSAESFMFFVFWFRFLFLLDRRAMPFGLSRGAFFHLVFFWQVARQPPLWQRQGFTVASQDRSFPRGSIRGHGIGQGKGRGISPLLDRRPPQRAPLAGVVAPRPLQEEESVPSPSSHCQWEESVPSQDRSFPRGSIRGHGIGQGKGRGISPLLDRRPPQRAPPRGRCPSSPAAEESVPSPSSHCQCARCHEAASSSESLACAGAR